MTDEQENTSLRKQKNTQNIDEKSKILKIAFANHNRHISFGAIKEIINSKPDAKSFETFKDIIDELEFEMVELQSLEKSNAQVLDNAMCFFEEGSYALLNTKEDGSLSLSFKGKRKIDITVSDLLTIPKLRVFSIFPKYEPSKNINNRIKYSTHSQTLVV